MNAATLIGFSSLILVKVSAITLIVLLIAQLRAASASRELWLALCALLVVIPIFSLAGPQWSVGAFSVQHSVIDRRFIGVSAAQLVILVWAAGVALRLLDLARASYAGSRLVNHAATIDDARTLKIVAEALRFSAVRKRPQILVSDLISSPAVFGRTVLLPASALEWPEEQLLAVLCHELAHVQRRDWTAAMAEQLIAIAYWPNPLIGAAWRRSAASRELAADQAALKTGISPRLYAERILAVARACTGNPTPAVVGFGAQSSRDLAKRVSALFDTERENLSRINNARRRAVIVLVGAFALLVSGAQIVACVTPDGAPTESISCP